MTKNTSLPFGIKSRPIALLAAVTLWAGLAQAQEFANASGGDATGRGADGHQISSSATTTNLSSIDQPAHDDFILAPSYPYDWRSTQLQAQNLDNINVQWITESFDKKDGINFVRPDGSGGYYAIKRKNGSSMQTPVYYLDHLDKNFTVLNSSEGWDWKEQNCKFDRALLQFLVLDGKLMVWSTYTDKKSAEDVLVLEEIDKASLMPKANKKLVARRKGLKWGSPKVSSVFDIVCSEDRSKVLMIVYPESEDIILNMTMMDEHLDEMWTAQKTRKVVYKSTLELDMIVTNLGAIFVVYNNTTSEINTVHSLTAFYNLEVYTCMNEDDDFHIIEMDVKSNLLSSVIMEVRSVLTI
jgi:hypothetical protein